MWKNQQLLLLFQIGLAKNKMIQKYIAKFEKNDP